MTIGSRPPSLLSLLIGIVVIIAAIVVIVPAIFRDVRNWITVAGNDKASLAALIAGDEDYDGEAAEKLGIIYDKDNAPDHEQKAVEDHSKADEKGNYRGTLKLAYRYQDGKGVRRDTDKAIEYFQRVADRARPTLSRLAKEELGLIYFSGDGVPVDYRRALPYLNDAAESDFPLVAQALLGRIYAEGLGTAKDRTRSCNWFRKASGQTPNGSFEKQYLTQAQYVWALCLSAGQGAGMGSAGSKDWMKKAAAGVGDSQKAAAAWLAQHPD